MRISDWSSDVCSSDLGSGERVDNVEQPALGVVAMYRVEIIIKGTADEMALAVRIAKATLHRDGVCHIEIDVSKERIIFDRLPAEIRSSGKWHRQQSARPVYLREIRDDAISIGSWAKLIDFAVLIISTDGDPHARCGVVRQAQFLVEVTNISVVGDIIIVLHRSAVIRRPVITLIVRLRSDRGQGQKIGRAHV